MKLEDDSASHVLKVLQFIQVVLGCSKQNTITIIKFGKDQWLYQCFRGVNVEKVPNPSYSLNGSVNCALQLVYMQGALQFAIKISPKISDEITWFDYIFTNSDVNICSFVEFLRPETLS